ncbi:nucleotide-binding domain-containing protein [Burkholderia glumae]|uniref:nucleotide-binding domain-containing protein n=1 Tax=Burkholderia glumae TaxID=337 RepID=UPI0020371F64|nr:nucleotidyltransferase [Burkholderia glumae]MCM2547253.1 nucleotidyltransferase [Burkholderia glumae]
MSTASVLFAQFRKNISVGNASDISTSYQSITTRLNKDFYDLESNNAHCLQVGSYGRRTAIHGISDLDMLFELPWNLYERYRKHQNNGPSQLLQAVRDSLIERYPRTEIKGDGQVVVVQFAKFKVEVLPAFYRKDTNDYIHPDTKDGGSWKVTFPQQEMDAMRKMNERTNRNFRHACKMLRSWKNEHGAPMSGILIDTLCYRFFEDREDFDEKSYAAYPELFAALFTYLRDLEQKDYWRAPGSLAHIKSKGNFHRKAKKAAEACVEARDEKNEKKRAKLWRDVFGRDFPVEVQIVKAVAMESLTFKRDNGDATEEFIEDKYPVDIRRNLEIECDFAGISNSGRLRALAARFPWLKHGMSLRFHIERCDVEEPYDVMWKVRNVGDEAVRRNNIRGQILRDEGQRQRKETANFHGRHFVECFVIKDGICVARDRIDVPIE